MREAVELVQRNIEAETHQFLVGVANSLTEAGEQWNYGEGTEGFLFGRKELSFREIVIAEGFKVLLPDGIAVIHDKKGEVSKVLKYELGELVQDLPQIAEQAQKRIRQLNGESETPLWSSLEVNYDEPISEFLANQVDQLNEAGHSWRSLPNTEDKGLIILHSRVEPDACRTILEPDTKRLYTIKVNFEGLMSGEKKYLSEDQADGLRGAVQFRVRSTIHAIEASRVLEQRREPNFGKN